MFRATRLIYDELKQADSGYKVFTEENDRSSRVWLQWGIDNGPNYRIQFISTDDDSDVSVRVYGLVNVTEAQKSKLVMACNELNSKYRFVKFVIDKDLDLNVEYDFPVDTISVESCAEEIMLRFVKIIREAYPELMRAIWS